MLAFSQFLTELKPYSRIGITAPAGADGDSVGTQCALKEILLALYPAKKIHIINEEPCPRRYRFLPGSETFEVSEDLLKSGAPLPEVMICVDGGASRIGDDTTKIWSQAKKTGQVDHHAIGAQSTYDFRLYDPEAASTTEIIYNLCKSEKIAMTPTLAQAIYVGLVFDTGLFKHSNTKPSTMRIAADLLETKFNHTSTVEHVLLMKSQGALKMLREVLASSHFEENGRYAWGVLTHEHFVKAGGDADDREGIIDLLFLTPDSKVAAFYFERHPGEWKVSFRSRGPDVASLAKSLNVQGGGHKLAAGCSLSGTQSEVLELCHRAVRPIVHA